jgi:hypothetical protein
MNNPNEKEFLEKCDFDRMVLEALHEDILKPSKLPSHLADPAQLIESFKRSSEENVVHHNFSDNSYSESFDRAARNLKDLTPEIEEQMRKDRDASKNKK